MARGLFITGFTISEVLAIQQRAKGFLIKGKTLSHKTCPNFTPVLPRLNLEEITPFTTPNPFIYIDSACLRSRHEYPNLSSKLIVCLAVYFGSLFGVEAVKGADGQTGGGEKGVDPGRQHLGDIHFPGQRPGNRQARGRNGSMLLRHGR